MDHPEDLTPEELAALSDEMTDASKLTHEELRALLQRRLDRLRQERRKMSDKLQELDPSAEGYGALMNYLEKDSQKHRETEAQLAQLQKRQTGITSITIQNFKGISAPVTIPLRPITLLFGANSAGKSTILQAIHYVRELLDRNNANPDQTLLGGEAIEMGGFRNLVHKHDLEREIRIRLEITPTDDGVPTLEELLEITDQENGLAEHNAFNINSQVQTVALELAARWDFGREEGWFFEARYFVNGESILTIRKPKPDSLPAIEEIQYFHPVLLALDESIAELKKEFDQEMRRFRAQWLVKMVDFAEALSLDGRPEFEFDLVHSSTKATIIKRGELIDRNTIGQLLLNLPNVVCTANSAELFPVFRIFIEDAVKKFKEKEHELLKNCGFFPLIQLNGQISPVPNFLRPLPFAPSALGDEGQAHWATINQILIGVTALARQHLEGFRYIGPIRAIPDRHHEAPQVEDPSRWASGLGAWDLLLRHYDRALGKGDAFVEEVSKWFEDANRSGLGYRIEVAGLRSVAEDSLLMNQLKLLQTQYDERSQHEFREKILKPLQESEQTPRIRILDMRTGTEVGPKDIGIGVAQSLPIVVGALDSKCPFLAVEQPELHLHPRVACNLADLFISQISFGKLFLIETHSEHLMLRLKRRIRENQIVHEDVAVLYVEAPPEGGRTRILNLRLDQEGEFIDEWPRGFFEEDFDEIFDRRR
jgi:predicted ATPase